MAIMKTSTEELQKACWLGGTVVDPKTGEPWTSNPITGGRLTDGDLEAIRTSNLIGRSEKEQVACLVKYRAQKSKYRNRARIKRLTDRRTAHLTRKK